MSKFEDLKPPPFTPGRCLKPEDAWRRKSFECWGRVFTQNPGEDSDSYTSGNITVYHDQQCSTAWTAQIGSVRTDAYLFPEYAIETLLRSLESVK